MAQSLDLFLNVGSMVGTGMVDLNADLSLTEAKRGPRPGSISIINDAFGLRIFKYGRTAQSGGMAKGELTAKRNDNTGTVTATGSEVNDTTHLSDTSQWTADAEVGQICHITDNNDVAGGPPEGEVAVVVANTASTQTFDANYALTVAPATSDTYRNISIWLHDDSADGDLAVNVLGVLMADRSAGNFGWVQMYGLNPGTLYTTSAVTAGNPVVADAAAVGPHACDTEQLWVGYSPGTIASDLASPFRSLCFLDLWHMAQPIA